jgi:glycosyltransferase involved in cell wall biosynthesis
MDIRNQRDAPVSVVVPLYNHERYIEAALESVLCQSRSAAEIIVVDDGSTDGSAAIAQRYADRYSQIRFWRHPNQGAHYTINTGIHLASGNYVAILNSDDTYYPTRLEECVAVLERDSDVCAVATGLTFIDGAGAATTSEWYDNARSFYDRSGDLSLALIRDNFFVTTSNLFVRKYIFEEIGYFSPLRYTHDLDFSLRLLACGKQVHFLEKPLLKYRVHASNTIREGSTRINIERAAVVAFYLYSAWLQRTLDDKDWPAYLRKLAKIADERALGVLLRNFLGHLDQFPAANHELGPWTGDIQFRCYARETFGAASGSNGHATRTRDLLYETQRLAEALHLLQDELANRDAAIAEQKAATGRLEEDRQWLAGQNERLQQALARQNEEIERQRGRISTLEEAKQWLAGQSESLQKELAQREAIIGELKAWIGVQDEGNVKLIGRNQQLQEAIDQLSNELNQIKRSRLWRLLVTAGLVSQRPK